MYYRVTSEGKHRIASQRKALEWSRRLSDLDERSTRLIIVFINLQIVWPKQPERCVRNGFTQRIVLGNRDLHQKRQNLMEFLQNYIDVQCTLCILEVPSLQKYTLFFIAQL